MNIIERLHSVFRRSPPVAQHSEGARPSLDPVTVRTQTINRGVEDAIERHSYRGNPAEDDKWPDQNSQSA